MSRAKHLESMVSEGWRARDGRLIHSDGRPEYYNSFTSYGMEYATWLDTTLQRHYI